MNNCFNSSTRPSQAAQRGLTLVELMVAMGIGLVIVAAMSVLFVGSSRSRTQTEISADVIETGRYALDLLSRELSQAGFFGPVAAVNISGATNAPCSTTATEWADSLTLHALAWNSSPAASSTDADPTCLSRKAGTDALFVQRASSCFVGEAGCDPEVSSKGYLQVTECSAEYVALTATAPGVPYLVKAGGSSALTLKNSGCTGTAPKRELIRRFYYVDGTDNALKSVDVTLAGMGTPVVLAENIEQMQMQYAIATSGSVGTAQTFSDSPTAAEWPHVIGARVWIVARSSDKAASVPSASFEIGDFVGTNAVSYAAESPGYKRRVYTTYIPFVTPKFRVEK